MIGYKKWDIHTEEISKEILSACLEANIPIEYNVNGLRHDRGYPRKEFWDIVREDFNELEVIIGTDAHNPADLEDRWVTIARNTIRNGGFKVKERL